MLFWELSKHPKTNVWRLNELGILCMHCVCDCACVEVFIHFIRLRQAYDGVAHMCLLTMTA